MRKYIYFFISSLSQEVSSSRPLEGSSRVEASTEGLDMEVEEIGDSEVGFVKKLLIFIV